jgi:hypothetical protein
VGCKKLAPEANTTPINPFDAMSNTTNTIAVPRHVWVVGVLALLWNAMGALDYTMTQMRNAAYMKDFTPEQLAYFYNFPKWVISTWAISVWGGVLGSLALLLRSRWAVPVFAVSLTTMAMTFVHNYLLSDGMKVMGGVGGLVFTVAIVAVGTALLVYARWLAHIGAFR